MKYNTQENNYILDAILKKYGTDSQLDMFMEESLELCNALLNFELNRLSGIAYLDFKGEIADVMIMTEQIKRSEYGKQIQDEKDLLTYNYKFYGIQEHRKKLCLYASETALLVRKKLSRPDKEFDLMDMIRGFARLDKILDCIKEGDRIGVEGRVGEIKELYQERITKVEKRVFNG